MSSDLGALIESVYAAAVEPARWVDALDGIAGAVQSAATHILVTGRDPGGSVFAGVRNDPENTRLYQSYYGSINPYLNHPGRDDTPGLVHSGSWCDPSAIRCTEFYADFLERRVRVFPVLVANLFDDGARKGYFATYRPLHASPFGAGQARLLRVLVPHLQRACEVMRALARPVQAAGSLLAALDHLDEGAVILDGRGRPWALNARARAILDEGDGLALTRAGLEAAALADRRSLAALVTPILDARWAGHVPPSGGRLSVARPSGRPPLALLVAPICARRASARAFRAFEDLSDAAVLVLVKVSDEARSAATELFRRRFGLTPREVEVARLLIEGRRIQDVARELGVSYHTARTHQRVIYEKMDVHDKVELLLVAGSAAVTVGRARAGRGSES